MSALSMIVTLVSMMVGGFIGLWIAKREIDREARQSPWND